MQGYPIGLRLLDLLLWREQHAASGGSSIIGGGSSSAAAAAAAQRPTRVLALLQFITAPLWRQLFARPADALERSRERDDEYMISDNEPVVNAYISVPRDMSQLNCAAFVAGIIEGVCDGAGFGARVTAHSVASELWPARTVFLLKFAPEVMERESFLQKV
jgi:hypothetical protein